MCNEVENLRINFSFVSLSVMNIFQGLSALMCLLTISKEFGEHHFHELSGKTDIPSLGKNKKQKTKNKKRIFISNFKEMKKKPKKNTLN
jgi:hypothetical protein